MTEGPAEELQEILARGSASLYRLAYKFLGNTADAEDAVQDAVFAAYKHLGSFRGQSQMSTWLHAIVANCARMRLRKQRRHVHVSLDSQVDDEQENSFSELLVDERPSPEDECHKTELSERVTQLIANLPPSLRRTYQLHHIHQLSICEIASTLGVPHGTVKARLARARGKLMPPLRRTIQHKRASSGRSERQA
jgi:RNA polymerase sigma-70 factor (ECF subfamily)